MFKNILWDLVGKFGAQAVSFVVSILLTRLLLPEEYGIMGMAMVIVAFAHVFLELGFNRAIVQQPNLTSVQLSTIFYINVGFATLLTLICFLLAKPLSIFYNQPIITPVFRVVSVSFLINGLNLVPAALLYKSMRFKAISVQTLIASAISGTVGVLMAYNGFGVWSLVAQSLIGSLLILIFNVLYVRWFPSLTFSLPAIKPVWNYGSKLFASGVLDSLFNRLDAFIIGKVFSAATLGYYFRAQGMDNLVRQFSANSITGTLFPYIAKHQDDRVYLTELYLKYLHFITFISVGLSGVLFLIAKPLFTILFTARWLYAAELFQLMSIAGLVWPVSSLMCNIIVGIGNASAFLKLEVYKKLLILPVYVFGFFFGLKGFILILAAAGFISLILNGYFVAREISITTVRQLKVVFGYFILGVFACALSYFIYYLTNISGNLPSIVVLGLSFSTFYIIGAFLAKLNGKDIFIIGYQKLKLTF